MHDIYSGVITATHLGYDERGTLTFLIDIKTDSGFTIGFGGNALSYYDGVFKHFSTCVGEIVSNILDVLRVDKWEELVGKVVFVGVLNEKAVSICSFDRRRCFDLYMYRHNASFNALVGDINWDYDLSKAPIDEPIFLLSEDSFMLPKMVFCGTIERVDKGLVKGSCVCGNKEYFNRSKIVAWSR